MTDVRTIALQAHGDPLPDWIGSLVDQVETTSQNRTAKLLGYSAATLSTILRGKYQADTAAVEERVRGVLMRETITCPGLGEIGKAECQDWRRKAKAFAGHNPMRVQMARACRACPVNKRGSA